MTSRKSRNRYCLPKHVGSKRKKKESDRNAGYLSRRQKLLRRPISLQGGWPKFLLQIAKAVLYKVTVAVSDDFIERDGIHQIVSRFLERFRYMCPLLFFWVFPS
jgi:hypothetical protein